MQDQERKFTSDILQPRKMDNTDSKGKGASGDCQRTQDTCYVDVKEDIFQGEGECSNNVGIIPNIFDHEVASGSPIPKSPFRLRRASSSEVEKYKSSQQNDGGYVADHWMLTELQMQMLKVTEECSKLKEDLLSAQEENFNLLVEKEDLQEKHSQRIKALQERLRQSEEDLEDAKNVVSSAEDLNSSLKCQLAKVEQDCSEMEERVSDMKKETEVLTSELLSSQAQLKSKEEEIEVIRSHSEEYLENWISKDKLTLEHKIRELEENLNVMTQFNNFQQHSTIYNRETEVTKFESMDSVMKSNASNNYKFNTSENIQESPESTDETSEGFESLHAEITEIQQDVLVPIFGGVGRCDASTQVTEECTSIWSQAQLKSQQEEIEVIRSHSDEYLETWIVKEKLALENKIKELQENLHIITQSNNNFQQHSALCNKEGEVINFEITHPVMKSPDASNNYNFKTLENIHDSSESTNLTKSDCDESCPHIEIKENQQTALVPIFSVVEKCDASTQVTEECTSVSNSNPQNVESISVMVQTIDSAFEEAISLPQSMYRSACARALKFFEIGFLMLLLLIALLCFLPILIPMMLGSDGIIGCLDLPTMMAKHGRLEHVNRPII